MHYVSPSTPTHKPLGRMALLPPHLLRFDVHCPPFIVLLPTVEINSSGLLECDHVAAAKLNSRMLPELNCVAHHVLTVGH
ncbi:hypothetical protein ACLOJK_006942 [Asimina triloba]